MEKLGKRILDREEIRRIVKALAEKIVRDYQGKDLIVLGVLKGAFMFMADLVRELDLPLSLEFMRVRSYDEKGQSGKLSLEFDVTQPVKGKDVLVLEDVVDTGQTLRFIQGHLEELGVASIRVCALLKKETSPRDLVVDYVGKVIPQDYVVGYGMDLDGRFRNLPEILSLSPDKILDIPGISR